jgi:NAD(P)H-hydrate epimerase
MSKSVRVCNNSEIREIDRIAETEYGLDTAILMENAGRAAAQVIVERFPHVGKTTEILIFSGKGNNAGDAFVVARRLLCMDRKVRIFHLESESGYKDAALKNFRILKAMKAKLTHLETSSELQAFFDSSPGLFTVIDGILGTGLKGTLEGLYHDCVQIINEANTSEVISLDIPTGVSGDTGEAGSTSVHADLTISFGFPKMGHFLAPGAALRGELVNVDISLPPRFNLEGDKFLLRREPMQVLLKERNHYGHKNSFGHTLLIGGAPGRIGAIVMAARAAHKMGTGLVTVASWRDSYEPLMAKLPSETMVVPIETGSADYEQYKRNLPSYSSVVVGPGLGLRVDGKQVIEDLFGNYQGPIVVDADALNLIADHKLFELLIRRRAPTILTPHPGEMARLLNCTTAEVISNPVHAVQEAVRMTHSTVLLKGAATLITSPDDVLYLNHYPNDGMAKAGSGDVLAGMIGGLMGQKMAAFPGALLGVYLHSLAGQFAATEKGHRSMTAADIIENICNAFKDIKTPAEVPTPRRTLDGRTWLL